jgi:hypothetical protein
MNGIETGMLPSCWGPGTWMLLHSMAYVYNPSKDQVNYYNFFSTLGSVLPCEECRNHYKKNLSDSALKQALVSNESFFRLIYDLHNKVNQQTGVPKNKWPAYESVLKFYSTFEADCSDMQGACKKAKKKQKRMKVVEHFGNISSDQLPLIIVIVVLVVLFIVYAVRK